MRRPLPGQMNGPVDPPFVDAAFKDDHPTLCEYLFCTTWEDGKPRTTTTLLFFVENGALKVCINDRDNNRSAFLSAAKFHELLDLLEVKLASDQLDWRSKSQRANNPNNIPF